MNAQKISRLSHYEVLGVSRCATPDEIRIAFQKLRHFWRPDVCADPRAAEMTNRVNNAWQILQDPASRVAYDGQLKSHEEYEARLQDSIRSGDLSEVEARIQADPELLQCTDPNGFTPLHLAAAYGHPRIVKLLLDHKADLVAQSNEGWTCLHAAAYGGNVDAVNLLVAQKSDVDALTAGGRTPLHYAAAYGHTKVVEVLLENGADIHLKSNDGWTSLHEAACTGHKDVAELLLANHADINPRSSEGLTALDYAKAFTHPDVVDLLRAHGGYE
jgi:ankyrin repeat protein